MSRPLRLLSFVPVLLLWSLAYAQAGGVAARRGTIIVHITGFRSDKGHARVGVFKQAKGFPLDSARAATGARVPVQDREATAVFADLPYGSYAVIAHHDENDNYKLDVNWLDLPKEMYGASNNPRARIGPPRWKDAKFELSGDSLIVVIKLHK